MGIFEDLAAGLTETSSLAGIDTWITLGINIILSTIVTGVVLLVVVGIMNKAGNEAAESGNAFLMALLINIINFVGIGALLGSVIAIPYVTLLLPLLIWIGFSKIFFSTMSWKHVLIVGILGYVLSILLVPFITGIISSFIPSF